LVTFFESLYAKQNSGLQVHEVIHADFVSDYASGPEVDHGETHKEWKVRVGCKLGMEKSRIGAKGWECTKFMEHIKPNWRSKKVSLIHHNITMHSPNSQMEKLNHDLQSIADEMATPAECQKQNRGARYMYYQIEKSS
jgi:hypothetical protein